MSGHSKRKWIKWAKNLKSETVVPTENCLHHIIPDQVVALNGQRVVWADRECRTTASWGEVYSVCNIDAWCSHTVTVDRQSCPDVESFLYADANHINLTILLLPFSFNMMQIQKMYYIFFVYLCQINYIYSVICRDFKDIRANKIRNLKKKQLYELQEAQLQKLNYNLIYLSIEDNVACSLPIQQGLHTIPPYQHYPKTGCKVTGIFMW